MQTGTRLRDSASLGGTMNFPNDEVKICSDVEKRKHWQEFLAHPYLFFGLCDEDLTGCCPNVFSLSSEPILDTSEARSRR